MLNRRILRAKAMQAVYAYQQAKKSNHTIATEIVRDSYLPDLNSMDYQDKDLISQHQTLALKVFENSYDTRTIQTDETIDDTMKKVVIGAIQEYTKMLGRDKENFAKRLVLETESIKAAYLFLWKILFRLRKLVHEDYYRERLSPNVVKNEGDLKFSKNIVLALIEKDVALQNEFSRVGLDHLLDQNTIRLLYQELKKDPTYKTYSSTNTSSFEEDKSIIDYILRTYFFKKNIENTTQEENGTFTTKEEIPLMFSYFDEHFIYWSENRETVKSMTLKTLKNINEDKGITLLELSPDWDGDLLFLKDLYQNTLENEEEYHQLIFSKTENWDSSRIAMVDSVILKIAIAEMIHCYSIPVKVTINEYIELSKKYSTPKSKEYINGMLHALSKELQADGKISKSGRGLMDNK